MKNNFYLRLALGNIRKNGKFYIPFLLTCVAAAAMFFNMCSIFTNDTLASRQDVRTVLGLGVIIIALFSIIFLFYTNSFLIKRRKKELALYNILEWKNGISDGCSSGRKSSPLSSVSEEDFWRDFSSTD